MQKADTTLESFSCFHDNSENLRKKLKNVHEEFQKEI